MELGFTFGNTSDPDICLTMISVPVMNPEDESLEWIYQNLIKKGKFPKVVLVHRTKEMIEKSRDYLQKKGISVDTHDEDSWEGRGFYDFFAEDETVQLQVLVVNYRTAATLTSMKKYVLVFGDLVTGTDMNPGLAIDCLYKLSDVPFAPRHSDMKVIGFHPGSDEKNENRVFQRATSSLEKTKSQERFLFVSETTIFPEGVIKITLRHNRGQYPAIQHNDNPVDSEGALLEELVDLFG